MSIKPSFKHNLDVHSQWVLSTGANKPMAKLKRTSSAQAPSPKRTKIDFPDTCDIDLDDEEFAALDEVLRLQSTSERTSSMESASEEGVVSPPTNQEQSTGATILPPQPKLSSPIRTKTPVVKKSSPEYVIVHETPTKSSGSLQQGATLRSFREELDDLDFSFSDDDFDQPVPGTAASTNTASKATTASAAAVNVAATPASTTASSTAPSTLSTSASKAELVDLLNLYRKLRRTPHDEVLLAQIDESEAALEPDMVPPTPRVSRQSIAQVAETPAKVQSSSPHFNASLQVISDSEGEDVLLDDVLHDEDDGFDPNDGCEDSQEEAFDDASEYFNELPTPSPPLPSAPQVATPQKNKEPIEIDSDELDFSDSPFNSPLPPQKAPQKLFESVDQTQNESVFLSSSPNFATMNNYNDLDDLDDDSDSFDFEEPVRSIPGHSTQAIIDVGIEDEFEDTAPPPEIIDVDDEYPWSDEVFTVLRKRFKLGNFRANQLHAINATLSGDDVLVLMPTGGGKSLCYQLPALVHGGKTKGVTVVISPLISLMQDQTEALLAKNISCAMFSSTQDSVQKKQTLSALMNGSLAMLYISPEMFQQSKTMQNNLTKLHDQGRLARIVIDEAHCVSSWGHDFRPDYKALVNVKGQLPNTPIMALTATANEKVRVDIQGCLRANRRFFKQSFNRPNLYYEVLSKDKNSQAEMTTLLRSKYKGQTGIIYCHSKNSCESTAGALQDAGIKAAFYHAGMETDTRSYVQAKWQSGEVQVVCATIAFGMGIDKADVRFVIHWTMPRNMEGYYQETGRAGRDGEPSDCLLYYCQKDAGQMLFNCAREEYMTNGRLDWELTTRQRQHHRELIQGVMAYCENRVDCRRVQVLRYFGEVFEPSLCKNNCDNCRHGHEYQRVEKNVTEASRNIIKMVSALQQSNSNVTLAYCIDVFRGSTIKKIKDSGHNSIVGYGAGKSIDRSTVERIMYHLITSKALRIHTEKNRSGFALSYIRPGENWKDVLQGAPVTIVTHVKGRQTGRAPLPRPRPTPRTTPTTSAAKSASKPTGFQSAHSAKSFTTNGASGSRTGYSNRAAPATRVVEQSTPSRNAASAAIKRTAKPVSQTENRSGSRLGSAGVSELVRRHWSESYATLEISRSDYCNAHNMKKQSTFCSNEDLELLARELPTDLNAFDELLPGKRTLYQKVRPALVELKKQRNGLNSASLQDKFAFKSGNGIRPMPI